MSYFRRVKYSLSLLMGIAAFMAATVQTVHAGAMDDRVTTLERISNAQAQLLQQLQQQLSDTQNDIASLRGEIQQNTYQLNQVVERQKQLYQQIDTLNAAKSGTAQSASPGDGSAINTTAPAKSDTKPVASAGAANVQSDDANADYKAAVDLILVKKSYNEAINALETWVAKYPNSTYQPSAKYWLGQLYYSKGNKEKAQPYFSVVAKDYPDSPKAPDALLKLGTMFQESKKSGQAKAFFQADITRYPKTTAAKQAQKSLNELQKAEAAAP